MSYWKLRGWGSLRPQPDRSTRLAMRPPFPFAPPRAREAPGQDQRPEARPDRPLRLARRDTLSKARGLVFGVTAGLLIWAAIAALLYGLF